MIVTFEEQADLRGSAGATRAERLEQVVRTLQRTAKTTQLPIRATLVEQRLVHEVDQVTYFWIFNGLSMTAPSEVIAEVASRPEVRSINLDETFPAPAPALSPAPSISSLSPSEENLQVIDGPALWQLGFQGQGVVVANMDSGVSVSSSRPGGPVARRDEQLVRPLRRASDKPVGSHRPWHGHDGDHGRG